jgi:hypothetical protein
LRETMSGPNGLSPKQAPSEVRVIPETNKNAKDYTDLKFIKFVKIRVILGVIWTI